MGVRRVDLDEEFWGWPNRAEWCEMVQRMGLDPNLVAVPGYIEADDEARTITAECYVRHEKQGYVLTDETGHRAKRVAVVVQLESRALPMPRVH